MTEEDQILSDEMMDAWVSFIKTGNPGWKPCTKTDPFVKKFDTK